MPQLDEPLRILLVEQNAEVNELFEQLFRAMGHTVYSATSQEQALVHARSVAPHIIYAALVFHRSMIGFDLCVELRKTPETADSLIIALSGLTYPGIEATAAEAGFDHYFLKPISMEMLMKTVDLLDHGADVHPPQAGRYAAASDASDIVSGPPMLV